jgi:pimeloyl-ACP methyl ester carboxylesterase
MVLTAGGRRTAPPEPGDDPRAVDMLRLGTSGTVGWALERWFTADALATPNHPGVTYVRRRWLANDPTAVAAGWNALRASTIRSRASEISVPVTIVACARDHTRGREDDPLNEARELANLIRGSEIAIVDGPHLVQLERPTEYADVVTAHLKRVGSL